jgi:hypothetical protein
MLRRAFTIGLCAALLGGCASVRLARSPASNPSESPASPASGTLTASPSVIVGRILAVDLRTLTAIVDISSYADVRGGLEGRQLVARTDELAPTARLQASPYLRGRTLGVRLLAGRPNIGDEVVLVPAAP